MWSMGTAPDGTDTGLGEMQMHFILHFFFASFAFLYFFLLLSCLLFPPILAIHGQISVTCAILTGRGAGGVLWEADFSLS